MRLFALISILTLLAPLAGECCVHGVEILEQAGATQPELHAATGCDCEGGHHAEHEDCQCLCQLPAAPPLLLDAESPLPLLGGVQNHSCADARNLSIPQDRPPIFA